MIGRIEKCHFDNIKVTKQKFETVEQYFASLAPDARKTLSKVREAIIAAAPDAEELIRYQIPSFRVHGAALVYYAAFKDHCSFFPANANTIFKQFKEELKGYEISKGTIRFPIDKPLPASLIKKIVRARASENKERSAAKAKAVKSRSRQ